MRTWITVDDFIVFTGAEPYTQADRAAIAACCDAVAAYLSRVRPDLKPLPTRTAPAGGSAPAGEYAALAHQIIDGQPSSAPVAAVHWAALQLVRRWWEKRGSGQASAFAEMGFIPSVLDKDIEELLQIGRSHPPAVA